MHNDSRMITKYIVETFTEVLAMTMGFAALALLCVDATQEYQRRKRLKGRKGL